MTPPPTVVVPAAPEHDVEAARPLANPYPGPSSRSFRVRLAAVAALALAVRLAYVLVEKRDGPPLGDAIYYSSQARTIARGDWFTNPFAGGPAADHPPLTSLLLAPADWVAPGSLLAQRLLVTAVGVVVVVLLGLLTRRLAGERAGLITAVVAALYANLWMNDALTMSETFSVLFIAIALLAAYHYADRPTVRSAALAGCTVGLAVLVRAEMLLLAPLVLLPLVLTARRRGARQPGRERVLQLLAAGVAILAVNAPWVVYNLTRFNDVVLFSANEGLTYRGANCVDTYEGLGIGFWSLRCALDDPPPPGLDQSEQSAWWRDHGFDYMGNHLGRLPTVMAVRVLRTWSLYEPAQMSAFNEGEDREWWASQLGVYSFWALAPAAVAGGVVLRRRGVLLLPLLALPVIVTLVAAWFYGLVRFRLPAEIVVGVLAAVAIDALVLTARRPATGPERAENMPRATKLAPSDRSRAPSPTIPPP